MFDFAFEEDGQTITFTQENFYPIGSITVHKVDTQGNVFSGEVDINAVVLQLPGHYQRVHCVSGEATHLAGDDEIKFTCFGVLDHPHERVALFCLGACDALVAVYLLEYSTDGGDTWNPAYFREDNVPAIGGCTNQGLESGQLTTGEDGLVFFYGLFANALVRYRLTEVNAPAGLLFEKGLVNRQTYINTKNDWIRTFHKQPDFRYHIKNDSGRS